MLTFSQASDLLCASQTSEAPLRNPRIGFRGNVTGGNELLVNSTGIRQVEPTGDSLINPGVTSTAEWCGSLLSGFHYDLGNLSWAGICQSPENHSLHGLLW